MLSSLYLKQICFNQSNQEEYFLLHGVSPVFNFSYIFIHFRKDLSMKEKQIFTNSPSESDNSYILDSGTTPYSNSVVAEELSAPLPYKKFLPEPTEEVRTLLKNAHGEIKYRGTNNYIFQAFLQENNDALKNLICSVLHMNTKSVKSIVITNPILLGKYIEIKTFILDIKVLLNDNTIINLEMQIENQLNWPERSLGYLCRSFDNLNTGADYLNTKPAIHIGFLDYCLFPDKPEFHATYKLLNVKNVTALFRGGF